MSSEIERDVISALENQGFPKEIAERATHAAAGDGFGQKFAAALKWAAQFQFARRSTPEARIPVLKPVGKDHPETHGRKVCVKIGQQQEATTMPKKIDIDWAEVQRERDSGVSVADLVKKYGVSNPSIYTHTKGSKRGPKSAGGANVGTDLPKPPLLEGKRFASLRRPLCRTFRIRCSARSRISPRSSHVLNPGKGP